MVWVGLDTGADRSRRCRDCAIRCAIALQLEGERIHDRVCVLATSDLLSSPCVGSKNVLCI